MLETALLVALLVIPVVGSADTLYTFNLDMPMSDQSPATFSIQSPDFLAIPLTNYLQAPTCSAGSWPQFNGAYSCYSAAFVPDPLNIGYTDADISIASVDDGLIAFRAPFPNADFGALGIYASTPNPASRGGTLTVADVPGTPSDAPEPATIGLFAGSALMVWIMASRRSGSKGVEWSGIKANLSFPLVGNRAPKDQ